MVRAERPGALVNACQADADQLQIEGWSAVPLTDGAAVVVSLQRGSGELVRVPAAATDVAFGRHGFRAAVPVTHCFPPPTQFIGKLATKDPLASRVGRPCRSPMTSTGISTSILEPGVRFGWLAGPVPPESDSLQVVRKSQPT